RISDFRIADFSEGRFEKLLTPWGRLPACQAAAGWKPAPRFSNSRLPLLAGTLAAVFLPALPQGEPAAGRNQRGLHPVLHRDRSKRLVGQVVLGRNRRRRFFSKDDLLILRLLGSAFLLLLFRGKRIVAARVGRRQGAGLLRTGLDGPLLHLEAHRLQ